MIYAIDWRRLPVKSVFWSEKLKCCDVRQLYRAVGSVEGEAEALGTIYQLFGGMGGVFVCGGNRSAHSPPSPSPSPSPPPPSSLLLLLPWPLSDHCCCACRPESSRVLLEGRCVQDARSSLSAVKGNPTEVGWAPRFSGRAQIAPRGEEKLAAALRKDAPGHVLPPDSFSYSLATSDLFSTFS